MARLASWLLLTLLGCEPQKAAPPPGPETAPAEAPGLRAQAEGREWSVTDKAVVARVQTRLKELGVYTGATDGLYRDDLQQALAEFQAARGLAATGKLDPATADALGIRWADVVGKPPPPGT